MLSLSLPLRIFLCVLPTDMRRGFDGLMRMAEEHLQQNVLEGGLFVFVNRRRDRVKLLYWDGDGLCVWYKNQETECTRSLVFTGRRGACHNPGIGTFATG